MKFAVRLSFNATIEVSVDAEDEGEALAKAREIAEKSDIRQFSICGENEATILGRDE